MFCLELLKTNELIRLGIKLTSVYLVSWLFLGDAILCNLSRKQTSISNASIYFEEQGLWHRSSTHNSSPKGRRFKPCQELLFLSLFSPYCVQNRSFVEVQQSSFSSFPTNSDDKLCSLVQNRLSKPRTFFELLAEKQVPL